MYRSPCYRFLKSVCVFMLVFGLFCLPSAEAARAPELDSLIERHLNWQIEGLGFDSVPIMRFTPQYDHEQALAQVGEILVDLLGDREKSRQLISDFDRVLAHTTPLESRTESRRFEMDGIRVLEDSDKTTVAREATYRVVVYKGGHAFRIVNYAHDYGATGNRVAQYSDAERMGRDLILKYSLVPKDELSQLALSKLEYAHFTGKPDDPGDRVVATSVVFGRRIAGVPVVSGGGSSIRIEFTANNGVRAISVDWTPIATTEYLTTPVSVERFETRFAGILKRSLWSVPVPANSPQSQRIRIQRMLCGYYDKGRNSLWTETMDLGCQVVYSQGNSSEMITIPLAEEPSFSSNWTSPEEVEELEWLGEDPQVSILFER